MSPKSGLLEASAAAKADSQTRTEMATKILAGLLVNWSESYNSTGEVVYDAVELTDLLIDQLDRQPGTVKMENYDDEQEQHEEEAEQEAEAKSSIPSGDDKKSRGWFGRRK